MMRTMRAFLVAAASALLAIGCAPKPQTQSVSVVIEGDAKAKAALEGTLRANPNLVVPQGRTNYAMIVVPPGSHIDYKILRVNPDPEVDYKIVIVDPGTGKEVPRLSKELGDALRKRLEQQLNPGGQGKPTPAKPGE
jgi:hypothetical protein